MTEEGRLIQFQWLGQKRGLAVPSLAGREIEFHPMGNEGPSFTFKATHDEGFGQSGECEFLCIVQKSYEVTEEQAVFLDSLLHERVMKGIAESLEIPLIRNGGEQVDEEGRLAEGFFPRRFMCPSYVRELLDRAEDELSTSADRLLRLLRWRYRLFSQPDNADRGALYCGTRSGKTLLAPLPGGESKEVFMRPVPRIDWDPAGQEALKEMWKESCLEEPLGHVLLREAINIAESSPRSAILISAAALEAAVKIHISNVAPATGWLMQEMPSPPIFKVLRDYIPDIHKQEGGDMSFWENLKPYFRKVEDLFRVRNKVAHTGVIPDDAPQVDEVISLVSDMLYLLDVIEGRQWARLCVSDAFRDTAGWPAPADGLPELKVKVSFG